LLTGISEAIRGSKAPNGWRNGVVMKTALRYPGPSDRSNPSMLAALLVALLIPIATTAHHSRAEFTRGAMHEIEGEVVRVVWRNPHVMLTIRARSADGSEKTWEMEAGDAGTLARRGLTDGYIRAGDRVRAAGLTSDRRENWLTLAHVLLSSGTEMVFGGGESRWSADYIGGDRRSESAVATAEAEPEGIFRVWFRMGQPRYDVIEQPPLTPAARTAWEAYDPLRDDPVLDCVLPGMPRVMTMTGSRPIEFEQRGEDILLHSENYNRTRIIHMRADEDAGEVEATPLGYSRGRWDGDTLIVTTNRISWPYFELPPLYGIPQSQEVEIVERFTLGEDELVYDFWANDPVNFTQPIEEEGFFVWRWDPDIELRINECEVYSGPDSDN